MDVALPGGMDLKFAQVDDGVGEASLLTRMPLRESWRYVGLNTGCHTWMFHQLKPRRKLLMFKGMVGAAGIEPATPPV